MYLDPDRSPAQLLLLVPLLTTEHSVYVVRRRSYEHSTWSAWSGSAGRRWTEWGSDSSEDAEGGGGVVEPEGGLV